MDCGQELEKSQTNPRDYKDVNHISVRGGVVEGL